MSQMEALAKGKVDQMTQTQFELLKHQLKLLTPQQLRTLQGEIHHNLDSEQTKLVTDEELQLISSLFS
ncbi:hypothetical protein [uncultured Vibrio sp.]|uniref:hypothetical protein n=1 Tax=uncultured Vibrio sp. TaxID=114054 RepID=UPI0025F21B3D|nr:hypothetical protein [uncultured Vibrio sp.]